MNKNNMRLISVVMNSNSKDNRSSDTISLLEYGFSNYGSELIKDKNDFRGTIKVKNSIKENYNYYLKDDIKLIVSKDTKDVNYETDIKLYDVEAPLKRNSVVGKYILKYNNKKYEYDLIIKEDIERISYFRLLLKNIFDVITGRINK